MFNTKNEYNEEVEFSTIEGYDRGGDKIQSKSFLNKSLFTLFIIGTISAVGYFGYNYFIQQEKNISPMKAVMGISVTNESRDNLNKNNLNRDDIEKGLDTLYEKEQNDIKQEQEIDDLVNQLLMAKETPTSSSKDISKELNGMVDMFYTQEAIPVELGNMVDDFYLENTPPEKSTKNSRYITIKEGDTLAGIAQKFYGNAMKYQKIVDANKRLQKDTNLYIGEKINIPY